MAWVMALNTKLNFNSMNLYKKNALLITCLLCLFSCTEKQTEEINIGYIGPLTARATDLGIAPSKAMQLAVKEYNETKSENEPKVNLFIADDKWEKNNALPAYKKLKKDHNISIVFISNSDGTKALENSITEDNTIVINPLNNGHFFSELHPNIFNIAKSTEEANEVIAVRLIELSNKKVFIMHFPNEFMTRAANSVKRMLDESLIESEIHTAIKGDTNFTEILLKAKNEGYDAYCFFGYKEFGYAMKQGRKIGIESPYYGSTTLLDPEFFDNSEGAIVGTECTFFTAADGNYSLAHEFLNKYESEYNETPFSVWPPMQAYDAMNLVLNEVRTINETKIDDENFGDWLRKRMYRVRYFQGICGNISIQEDGASRGIYFSVYKYESKGILTKVKR